MESLPKVWGYKEGDCAWCLKRKAVSSYQDYTSQDELVEYQVCLKCKKDFYYNDWFKVRIIDKIIYWWKNLRKRKEK